MQYWLLKSEPASYSWDRLVAEGRAQWDGVRNFQAAANLKAMKKGDRGFFYHSGEGPAIVGTVEITREAYPDPSDKTGKFVMVDLAPRAPLKTPVTLAAIKAEPKLGKLPLVKQGRLSVSPVGAEEWRLLCKMGGIAP
jgi:predicted RNA-binding protein with PUA-like domain